MGLTTVGVQTGCLAVTILQTFAMLCLEFLKQVFPLWEKFWYGDKKNVAMSCNFCIVGIYASSIYTSALLDLADDLVSLSSLLFWQQKSVWNKFSFTDTIENSSASSKICGQVVRQCLDLGIIRYMGTAVSYPLNKHRKAPYLLSIKH